MWGCSAAHPARLQDRLAPGPPADTSVLTSKASQTEVWMFREKPPRLLTVCGRTRAHLCLMCDTAMAESVEQDHLCLTPVPVLRPDTGVNLPWFGTVRKVRKCSLLFPTCNKAVLSAFPSGRLSPLTLQMPSALHGAAPWRSHTQVTPVWPQLCACPHVWSLSLPVLWEHPRATPVGAHTCGSTPGPLISRKHFCLHTLEVPDGDDDSPRDLLTSLPTTVTICLSGHLVLFLSLKRKPF